jgi:hypothetical protein
MDFFVDVYETFDVIQPGFGGPVYETVDVIETVTPGFGVGFGVGIMPTMMPYSPVAVGVTNVCPQYGYRPAVRPVQMVQRGGYINGPGPCYGGYPPQRFY